MRNCDFDRYSAPKKEVPGSKYMAIKNQKCQTVVLYMIIDNKVVYGTNDSRYRGTFSIVFNQLSINQ